MILALTQSRRMEAMAEDLPFADLGGGNYGNNLL